MRLLHAASLKFKDFPDSATIPPYAILSHTWEDKQEVTLQDMSSPYLTDKKGYAKITSTCTLALQRGLEWAWIDTCCIDKTNNTELTESINSMFNWYQCAAVCFVHLVDLDASPSARVSSDNDGGNNAEDGHSHRDYVYNQIRRCAWFRRGWTLQELLAPHMVEFYDARWSPIGSKIDLAPLLADITHIPVPAILGEERLSSYSTAQRMAWASQRVTTKVEDLAYCLLGLFDVYMPLIYGEGRRAFQRLQEEIIKRTTDLTLFAWMPSDAAAGDDLPSTQPAGREPYMPLLAPSPAEFEHCHQLSQFRNDDCEFAVTNRGLRISTYLVLVPLALDMEDHRTHGHSHAHSHSHSHSRSPVYGVDSEVGGGSNVSGGSSSPPIGTTGSTRRKPTAVQYTRYRYVLSVGFARGAASEIGISLKKVGPGLFLRDANPSLAFLSKSKLKSTNTTENHSFYIIMHPNTVPTASASGRSARNETLSMVSASSPTLPPAPSVLAGGGVESPRLSTAQLLLPHHSQQQQPPTVPTTSAAAVAAATATLTAHQKLCAVYHPRLFPRGMHIPYFGDRHIYFSSFPPQSWDERTRIFCQPESRNDVVAFSCASRQGPDGRDNLSFGVLVDYRLKRDGPRCLVINRHALDSRFLFVLSMRQQGEPVRWYVMENELPQISASTNVLRMTVGSSAQAAAAAAGQPINTATTRTYEVVASIIESRVQIDEHTVMMPTLDIKITRV
ncbi:hypothetical protein SPBR_01423 [Sporothrix brasiliensis 5110]|uniref:Uncharacterized protein n=1 Tax=Sporothrix brasiliensis 5110 TaxID=1398154 RepID=A0A0C2J227_9PEZI|nr:uncharacterized protein SPBR_01423 [Sporothrix brasiliensis 5110]KIH91122.1 hypothetical protein SPBR_01423 [Sporothrix brasiliensis 5110]